MKCTNCNSTKIEKREKSFATRDKGEANNKPHKVYYFECLDCGRKMSKNENMPELITLQEACDILKCHPNTLRQWDKKGILVAVRFGERKDRRYRKEDILKLLNQKKQ